MRKSTPTVTAPTITIAFLFSMVFLLVVAVAMPFKDLGDDYFAKACNFALPALFFFSFVLRQAVLTEEVDIKGELVGGGFEERRDCDILNDGVFNALERRCLQASPT